MVKQFIVTAILYEPYSKKTNKINTNRNILKINKKKKSHTSHT